MAQYIDKDATIAEIEKRKRRNILNEGAFEEDINILSFLNTLEVKEVDLEKLGGIARHLIAVKEHIEDMRLEKDEWSMLEKIGYPKIFKAQKGENYV